MAARKMTFSLPEDLASKFVRRVPSRERSQFISRALEQRLSAEDQELIEACLEANSDADTQAIESEFDGLGDDIAESWDDAPSR